MSDGKKTILYLMEYPIDLAGGGQESTKTLCAGLASSDEFEPVVACPDLLSTNVSDYSFRIVTYPSDENRELSKIRRITNFIARIRHFGRIIRAVKPDLIHVSMSESLITFAFLRVPGFFANIPFVYTDRGLCYGYRRHSKTVIKFVIKRAERMLTTTEFNASLWRKEISAPITVIPNTISVAFSDYDPSKREELRKKYGVADKELVIGFAGRISEEKDWGKVPGVVKALKDAKLLFKVALVMSVYEDRDAQISRSVRDGIISSTGSENLIYMQDLNQKEMSQYYYLVDIFIMTSCFESFGKAAVEAMSRKCVVLSTPVGGLPEVIGNKDDLYDMNDLKKLTDRVSYYVHDPEAMERARCMYYDRYRNNYTVEKNIEGHAKLYREILGSRDND